VQEAMDHLTTQLKQRISCLEFENESLKQTIAENGARKNSPSHDEQEK
jgi:hypothetical protein